jgi:hypothetical protein
MNKTMRFFGKVKSGRPNIGKWRRHPVIAPSLRIRKAASSVVAFPRERTFPMISERLFLLNLSTEFASQPLINRPLFISGSPPDLAEEPNRRRFFSGDILCPLVACGAKRTQI